MADAICSPGAGPKVLCAALANAMRGVVEPAQSKLCEPCEPHGSVVPNTPLTQHVVDDVVVRSAAEQEKRALQRVDCTARIHMQVFAWLKLMPPEHSPCTQTIERCFPGALPGAAVLHRSADVLSSRFGCTPENTLYGNSVCPDEINQQKGGLPETMANFWGECFPLGGIGGAPFVGKTGFGAFSSHVPQDGNILILFGPHIAISEEGELGKYRRLGQTKLSSACGAVLAAYASCCRGDVSADPDDMEQSWLKASLAKSVSKVKRAKDPLQVLITEAYKVVRDQILRIINTNFGSGRLILLGGIQINLPHPYNDFFLPLMFQAHSAREPMVDLLSEFDFESINVPSL